MSSLSRSEASQSASGKVKAMTPANPSVAKTRSSSARQRTDLLATRIGFPRARRTRSAAFAWNAWRSTIANGGSSRAVAASYRSRNVIAAGCHKSIQYEMPSYWPVDQPCDQSARCHTPFLTCRSASACC
jgi:hypothetical protein